LVTIEHTTGTILTGQRDLDSNLWLVDLPIHSINHTVTANVAFALNNNHKPAEIVAFAHAALFSRAISTLQQAAVNRNYIVGFPGLTPQTLRRHPPQSVATIKGHLDQSRKNQRLTMRPPPGLPLLPINEDDGEAATAKVAFTIYSGSDERTHCCFAACLPTSTTGQIFTNQTGRFIVPASTGNTHLFILYNYDSNSIHAEPMPNKIAGAILAENKHVHNMQVKAGLRPQLQCLDNECSEALKEYMVHQGVDFQQVPPASTVPTPPNAPSEPSRTISLQACAAQTAFFPSIYVIASSTRQR
jgi:hypothetical protein